MDDIANYIKLFWGFVFCMIFLGMFIAIKNAFVDLFNDWKRNRKITHL